MSNKGCELCSNPARMFCESDQASLCWDCDEKVHAANFLVAKHTRSLLCHVCQSPTPWKAAGPKLGPTVSICHTCAERESHGRRMNGDEEEDEDCDSQQSESDDDDDDDAEYDSDNDGYADEEQEDGENQVVPWSNSSYDPPSPPPTSCSSGSDENVSFTSYKRMRDNLYFESEDEEGCCSSQFESKLDASGNGLQESENVGSSLFRPLKFQRVDATGEGAPTKSTTGTIVSSFRILQQGIAAGEGDESAMILGVRKLARDS